MEKRHTSATKRVGYPMPSTFFQVTSMGGRNSAKPQMAKCHLVDSVELKQFLTTFKLMAKLVVLFKELFI